MINNFKVFLGIRFSETLSKQECRNVCDEFKNLTNYYQLVFNGEILVNKIYFQFDQTNEDLPFTPNDLYSRDIFNVLKIDFEWDEELFLKKGISHTMTFFEKRINDLIIAISIAKNGAVELGCNPVAYVNGQKHVEFNFLLHNIGYSIKSATDKFKWPDFEFIDLRKTLEWLDNFQTQTDVISTDKIGRALNAYSFLFTVKIGNDAPHTSIFWALVALEALYGEGNANLQYQINSKSQILLGKRSEYKKIFNEMYAYRSRLVHGDLDFQNKFYLVGYLDDNQNVDGFVNDYLLQTDLAIAILVGTLQKLIINNMKTLEFDYIIRP